MSQNGALLMINKRVYAFPCTSHDDAHALLEKFQPYDIYELRTAILDVQAEMRDWLITLTPTEFTNPSALVNVSELMIRQDILTLLTALYAQAYNALT